MKNLKVNTVLYTKDGRKIGNAIVIYNDDSGFTVKTDYGNIVHFHEAEIDELFYTSLEDITPEETELISSTHKNRLKTPF